MLQSSQAPSPSFSHHSSSICSMLRTPNSNNLCASLKRTHNINLFCPQPHEAHCRTRGRFGRIQTNRHEVYQGSWKYRTYKSIRMQLREMAQDYASIRTLKFSDSYIHDIKSDLSLLRRKSVSMEYLEEKFLKRVTAASRLYLTTSQVRGYYRQIYSKKPSRHALRTFRNKYDFDCVYNNKTKKQDRWVKKTV